MCFFNLIELYKLKKCEIQQEAHSFLAVVFFGPFLPHLQSPETAKSGTPLPFSCLFTLSEAGTCTPTQIIYRKKLVFFSCIVLSFHHVHNAI
jgi:hypothetical protein